MDVKMIDLTSTNDSKKKTKISFKSEHTSIPRLPTILNTQESDTILSHRSNKAMKFKKIESE